MRRNTRWVSIRFSHRFCIGLAFLVFGAPSAVAQAPERFVIAIEAQAEDESISFFVGTPVGDNAVLVLGSADVATLGDADNEIAIHGLGGGKLEGVIVEETFDNLIVSRDVRLQTFLLRLALPDGRTLNRVDQADEDLVDDADVEGFTFLIRDGSAAPRRLASRLRTVDTGGERFAITGITPSAPSLPAALGGFVFDTCGNLTAVAVPNDSSADTPLIPVTALSSVLQTNSVANDFDLAPACEASTGASKAQARADAAIAAAEEESRRNAEEAETLRRQKQQAEAELQALEDSRAAVSEIAEARQQLEAITLAQDENTAAQLEIQQQIQESRELLDEAVFEAQRAEEEAATAREENERAAGQLRVGRYLLIGLGLLVLTAIGVATWLNVRARRLRSDLAAVKDEKRDIEEAKAAAEARWHDCVLESEQGFTVKLPGSKLLKAHGGVTVGRSRSEADVVIDRDDVSRRHARFEVVNEIVELTDLGSTNKTRVNGGALDHGAPRRLYEGDRISFGTNEFSFKIVKS
ncbi:MAG: FHA domain-containing protein [Pseudomonadota bacterium]